MLAKNVRLRCWHCRRKVPIELFSKKGRKRSLCRKCTEDLGAMATYHQAVHEIDSLVNVHGRIKKGGTRRFKCFLSNPNEAVREYAEHVKSQSDRAEKGLPPEIWPEFEMEFAWYEANEALDPGPGQLELPLMEEQPDDDIPF